MQRQEMRAQLQQTLGEQVGAMNAPTRFRYDHLLSAAADDIAAKFKCQFGTASANIVANQIDYPAPTSTAETTQPTIIEIKAVTCYDALGNLRSLQMTTTDILDASQPGWRLWIAQQAPYYAVTLALNQFLLVPTPNYNSAFDPTFQTPGGYTVEGIAIPGHSWDAQTAECPLPTQVHPAVYLQAALDRIMQNPTKENLAREGRIEARLNSILDTFESSVMRYTQATRVPAYTTGESVGANALIDFNPLNQW